MLWDPLVNTSSLHSEMLQAIMSDNSLGYKHIFPRTGTHVSDSRPHLTSIIDLVFLPLDDDLSSDNRR